MPTDGGYDSDLYCGHEQDNFSSSPLEYDNEVESERTPDIQSATSPKPSPGASPAPNEEYIAKTPSKWEGYNYLQHDQRDFREPTGSGILTRQNPSATSRSASEATSDGSHRSAPTTQTGTKMSQREDRQSDIESRATGKGRRSNPSNITPQVPSGWSADIPVASGSQPSRRSSLRQRAIGMSGPRLPSPTSSKTSGEESGKSKLKSIFDTIFDESKAEVTLRLQSPGRDDCRSSARSTSSPRSSTVRDPRAPEANVLLSEQLAIYP
ncbi:hypothetical protein CROQUDRAFT_700311, partial [Cronartium quercuum f. sp. fusiforme G11]